MTKMKNFNNVSIVIPAKNEAHSLKTLVPELLALEPKEVLIVDDGSTDDTKDVCIRCGAKVLSHPISKGNGAAIKTGARNAQGSTIVFMDADGQHQAKDIKALYSKYCEGYHMVVGARNKAGQANKARSLANSIYNKLASYMTGERIQDLTSGFRIVEKKKFLEFVYLLPNKFSYPTTITMAFFRAGYSVAYERVDVLKREGESHLRPLRDGARFLIIIFKVGTLYSPLKLFVPTSFFMFVLGVIYYGYTYYEFNRFTNMSALLLTTSLLIFMVGLVSEQITALMYKNS